MTRSPIGTLRKRMTTRETAPELKAYVVTEEGENTGGIVWARHAITARRQGAALYNGGEFFGLSCRRAPWADAYAESPLPASLCIAHGWRFECCGCGATISEDWLDETGLPLSGVRGSQDSMVFCCAECEAAHDKRKAERKRREAAAVVMMRDMVLRRFPDAVIDPDKPGRAYVSERDDVWLLEDAECRFGFPGMKIGTASLRLRKEYRIGPDRPEFSCCHGDLEAFEAWAALTTRATDGRGE